MPSCAVSLVDYKASDNKKRTDRVCTLKDGRLILANFSLSVLGEEVAHLHTLLGGDTGKLFTLDIQRCGRKEVTKIQRWLLWLRWAALAMEVEIHREAPKLLTASQYSLHNINTDGRGTQFGSQCEELLLPGTHNLNFLGVAHHITETHCAFLLLFQLAQISRVSPCSTSEAHPRPKNTTNTDLQATTSSVFQDS